LAVVFNRAPKKHKRENTAEVCNTAINYLKGVNLPKILPSQCLRVGNYEDEDFDDSVPNVKLSHLMRNDIESDLKTLLEPLMNRQHQVETVACFDSEKILQAVIHDETAK
jgi:hypothetical protein